MTDEQKYKRIKLVVDRHLDEAMESARRELTEVGINFTISLNVELSVKLVGNAELESASKAVKARMN